MRVHNVFVPKTLVKEVFGTYDGYCLEKNLQNRITAIAVIPITKGFRATGVTIEGGECVNYTGQKNERILKGNQLNKIKLIREL